MAALPSISAPIKLSLPLDYQQDIFQEVRKEDVLTVLARGLGLQKIVINLLHAYDATGDNLVLLVGAEDDENTKIGEGLAEMAALAHSKARGLQVFSADLTNVGTREIQYAKGGIFTVTSRMLVVDLLTTLLKPESITGIVVLHAERVTTTSTEAFILRIFRQANKEGFIKAFSDTADTFASGYAPLSNMMRNLFVRQSSLWPRYQVSVARSLEMKKAEVVELEVAMTDSMKDIQNAVLHCIEVSISELRKTNAQLDIDDWSVDSALHKSFDVIIRRQLDPIWHRVSWRTRQIANDLTVLRNILQYLLTYDCVAFNQYLETVLAIHTPPPGSTRHNQSPWLFLDAAETIFGTARKRVYGSATYQRAIPDKNTEVLLNKSLRLEEQPKWSILAEILEETEINISSDHTLQGPILIMCSDNYSCNQVREYLQTMYEWEEENDDSGESGNPSASGKFLLRRKFRGYTNWKRDFAQLRKTIQSKHNVNKTSYEMNTKDRGNQRGRGAPSNKRRRIRGGGTTSTASPRGAAPNLDEGEEADISMLASEVQMVEAEYLIKEEIAVDPMENLESYYELHDMNNLVLIHPYNGDMDDHLLEEVRPGHIILYEPDAPFIRRIEVYRSSHRSSNVKVYFLYYGGSTEEQKYLSIVRREKDSFTKLIKEKGNMSVTLTLDGRGIDDPQERFLRTINTRIAGGGQLKATAQPPRVVVDVREFRSSLPSLLHGRSMVIVPCTLTVGDYILTPNICVERKSIKDLISSFKDGRLYTQAETMLLHYKHPMLLIEFDQNKSFNLEPFADLSQAANQNDLQYKLVLLSIAFPKLRIIWSSSPFQTAEIFEELKKGQEEPDPLKAVSIGLQEGEDAAGDYSQTPIELLRAIPGITAKSWKDAILEVESVFQLSNMEETELMAQFGQEAGRRIHRFMNRSIYETS